VNIDVAIQVASMSMYGILFLAPLIGAIVIMLRGLVRFRKLESWLNQGVPVCLKCAYPLRGVSSRVCPECGKPWDDVYPARGGQPVLPTAVPPE